MKGILQLNFGSPLCLWQSRSPLLDLVLCFPSHVLLALMLAAYDDYPLPQWQKTTPSVLQIIPRSGVLLSMPIFASIQPRRKFSYCKEMFLYLSSHASVSMIFDLVADCECMIRHLLHLGCIQITCAQGCIIVYFTWIACDRKVLEEEEEVSHPFQPHRADSDGTSIL